VSEMRLTVGRGVAAGVLAATLAGAVAGALTGLAVDNDDTAAAVSPPNANVVSSVVTKPTGASRSPEAIYRDTSRGVVVITDKQTEVVPSSSSTPSQKKQVGALGSGFVVDTRGDILTNDHVVQGATDIRVGFGGRASYPAKIVGTDPSSDLAVVRVNVPSSALHPLSFADSSSVEVGDPAYAIGNPFGLDRTMTAGIVSATGRDIEAPNGLTIPNAIQTDAPINHGNSGGPLLDRFGDVIGVNAQLEGGTVDANVGVGFAIGSATARSVTRQLISTGRARHPWLGVEIETIDATLAKLVPGLPKHGVLVVGVVKGSPAAKAGLEPTRSRVTARTTVPVAGDAIVAIDGKAVESSAQLTEIIALDKPGDIVKLEVVRGQARRRVTVTIGNAPG
jgi:putative serine protease PepD